MLGNVVYFELLDSAKCEESLCSVLQSASIKNAECFCILRRGCSSTQTSASVNCYPQHLWTDTWGQCDLSGSGNFKFQKRGWILLHRLSATDQPYRWQIISLHGIYGKMAFNAAMITASSGSYHHSIVHTVHDTVAAFYLSSSVFLFSTIQSHQAKCPTGLVWKAR